MTMGLETLFSAKMYHGKLKLSNVLLFNDNDSTIVKLTNYSCFPGNIPLSITTQ